MNDVDGEAFNNRTFSQDGNETAILRTKYYNPPNLIFQHLLVKEKVKNKEVNRLQNDVIDTLTRVDIQQIVKIGGKAIEFYEGVIYGENFKIPPFKKVLESLFALRKKHEDEKNDLLHVLVKLNKNSLFGVQIRRDINKLYYCKSETWLQTEYDENNLDYWKLPNESCFFKDQKRRWIR